MSRPGLSSVGCQDDHVVSDDDVQRFHDQGFLVLNALTTEAEVVALHDVYDRLFDPGAPITADDRIGLAGDTDAPPVLPQILNPDRYAPQLRETLSRTAWSSSATTPPRPVRSPARCRRGAPPCTPDAPCTTPARTRPTSPVAR